MEVVEIGTGKTMPELLPRGVVHKYGGSSVATVEKIKAVARRVAEIHKSGIPIAVVASAMGRTTDSLIALARETGGEGYERELDALLATGEQQTVALIAMSLRALGVNAISFTGAQCGIYTNANHSRSRIKDIGAEKVIRCIREGGVPVVAGFQGVSPEGDITTLGRGGSDTTAVALAARLGWDCDIYTDVDCVYTSDPRKLNGAKRVSRISPEEMAELSAAGAGVLETRSVELAGKYGVRLYLGRSLECDRSKGTYIVDERNTFETMPVTGAGVKPCKTVTVHGAYSGGESLTALFSLLSELDIKPDMLSQQADGDFFTLCFACSEADAARFISGAERMGINAVCSQAGPFDRVTLVGRGLSTHSDIGLRAFGALCSHGIRCLRTSAAGAVLSYIVEEGFGQRAVEAFAEEFGFTGE